jgi:hypothetical protein
MKLSVQVLKERENYNEQDMLEAIRLVKEVSTNDQNKFLLQNKSSVNGQFIKFDETKAKKSFIYSTKMVHMVGTRTIPYLLSSNTYK